MVNHIKFPPIDKSLRAIYEAANSPVSTCRDRLELCYALGKEIVRIENVLGKKEAILQAYSGHLYETFPHAEECQFALPVLKEMKRFYLTYRDDFMDKKIGDAICKVNWHHHTKHLCKITDPEERIFYLLETIENEWTCETLGYKIKKDYYRRRGGMLSNFDTTLSPELGSQVQAAFLKMYSFEFVKAKHSTEKELEDAIEGHRKQFIHEFGSDFIYIDRQHRIKWQGKVYFLDLILYHRKLNCFIIIELKRRKFKPEYVGKLNRYLQCANQVFNSKNHNNVIGIVLCESANDPAVKNDLMNSRLPIGVATYRTGA